VTQMFIKNDSYAQNPFPVNSTWNTWIVWCKTVWFKRS